MIPNDTHAWLEPILGEGLEFEGQIVAAGTSIREQSKLDYGQELLDARLMLTGMCASLLRAYNGVPGRTSKSVSDRLTLIASFLQGLPATETLISEGQYVKAAAALKQDMEVIARIGETIAGRARRGQTPQMKHFPAAGARRFYGELNKVAHPSDIDLLEELLDLAQLPPTTFGVGPVPVYVAETAVALYQLHVYLLYELACELIGLMMEMYDENHDPIETAIQIWLTVGDLLERAGHFQAVDGPRSCPEA